MLLHIVDARKGLDIPIAGVPDPQNVSGKLVRTVAVLGRDYIGLKPRIAVQPGDTVNIGDTLFVDKRDPDVPYTSPGSGNNFCRQSRRPTRLAIHCYRSR